MQLKCEETMTNRILSPNFASKLAMLLSISSAAISFTHPAVAIARMGGETGGGGDTCENRIKTIRDDISSWIKSGGPASLSLPNGVTVGSYSNQMLGAINSAKIMCVGPGDQNYPVQVNGTPKVCRFKHSGSGAQEIKCDFGKFPLLDESEQYVLVHHEFAGLADLEPAVGDDSQYFISNQISEYLVNVVVKKLAIKKLAVAMSDGDFDPAAAMAKGRQLYANAKKNLLPINSDLANLKSEIDLAQARLDSIRTGHGGIDQIISECGGNFKTSASQELDYIAVDYRDGLRELESAYARFSENVSRYISARDCSACDSEIRSATMQKYQKIIESSYPELKHTFLNRLDRVNSPIENAPWRKSYYVLFPYNRLNTAKTLERIAYSSPQCNFDKFFAFEDDDTFSELQRKVGGVSFAAKLSAGELLSGKYESTLRYLAKSRSIPVERTSSRYGKPYSRFQNGTVEVRVTYESSIFNDELRQYTPELTNPIHIIAEARN